MSDVRVFVVVAGVAALTKVACGGGDAPLPSLCLAEPAGGVARFTDASAAWGIDHATLDVEGGRLSSADLDGDGYPDVIVHRIAANQRVAAGGPAPYFVLMNRAPPVEGGPRQLADATAASGYGEGHADGRVAHFAIYGDVDNDGDLDVVSGVSTDDRADSGDRTRVLLNDGAGRFTAAPESDVGRAAPALATQGATLLDYDRDGLLDLYVANGYGVFGRLDLTQQDRLYRGGGDGTFTDTTDLAGVATLAPVAGGGLDVESLNAGRTHKPSYGVAACDVDGDGDADLLSGSYGRQMDMLWVNRGGRFEDASIASRFAMDGNRDYTDNEMYKCHCATTGDCQAAAPRIRCDGTSWTPGIDDQPFRLGGNTFAVACADVNDDGRADVLTGAITHFWAGGSSDRTTLLVNAGAPDAPRFDRPGNEALGLTRTWQGPSWNEGDINASVFDFDLDGRKDLLVASSDYPEQTATLFRQKEDGTFEDVTDGAGLRHHRAAGHAAVDLDRDGDLDIVMSTSTMRCRAEDVPPCPWAATGPDVFVYENDAAARHNWIAVRLAGGRGANRAGIGAHVTVVAEGRTQHYEVGGGHGHYGLQHDTTLHVGLGAACAIERIEVRWPDAAGTVTTHARVRANTFVDLGIDGTTREVR